MTDRRIQRMHDAQSLADAAWTKARERHPMASGILVRDEAIAMLQLALLAATGKPLPQEGARRCGVCAHFNSDGMECFYRVEGVWADSPGCCEFENERAKT